MADYRQYATDMARRYGIPANIFLPMIGAESSWNPNAVSNKGAMGFGQLMPATAKELGVDPTDPLQNIEGAARYLSQQYKSFGEWPLALAAYNAGPGAVKKYGGIPPYKETQNYVSKILGAPDTGRAVAADTMTSLGLGGQTMAQDQQPQQPQQERKGLLGGLLSDPDLMDRLAIGFAGMTLNPNTALQQVAAARIANRAEERKAGKERNATAEWLRSQGAEQLASGVTSGAVPASTALSMYQVQVKATQDPNVQSSAMLPDQSGSVLTMRDGSIKVITVGGETLTGQAAMDYVKKAQETNVAYQQSVYKARRLGTGLGETAAADISAAPSTISTADTTLAYIDAIKKHPGLEAGTGFSSTFNAIPGTPGYDFQNRVKQISSGAFMTAIQDLRGMGALSNAEGETATKAVARMDTATSKEEFLSALADYERIVQSGKQRAQNVLGNQNGSPTLPSTSEMSDQELIEFYGK